MADISFDDTIRSDTAYAPSRRNPDRKWSARRTLTFVVASSALLWSLILAPFFLF
ncbi:MAG: hypothetical protein ACK4M2_00205 [Brevundimonas sp.]